MRFSLFSPQLLFFKRRALPYNSICQDPTSSGIITPLPQQIPVHTGFHLCTSIYQEAHIATRFTFSSIWPALISLTVITRVVDSLTVKDVLPVYVHDRLSICEYKSSSGRGTKRIRFSLLVISLSQLSIAIRNVHFYIELFMNVWICEPY
jgi:hypothetical protein